MMIYMAGEVAEDIGRLTSAVYESKVKTLASILLGLAFEAHMASI